MKPLQRPLPVCPRRVLMRTYVCSEGQKVCGRIRSVPVAAVTHWQFVWQPPSFASSSLSSSTDGGTGGSCPGADGGVRPAVSTWALLSSCSVGGGGGGAGVASWGVWLPFEKCGIFAHNLSSPEYKFMEIRCARYCCCRWWPSGPVPGIVSTQCY